MSDDNLIQNAKKCLAYHGQDGFCEDYDCRSVLEAYELGVASANHRLHAQLAECERERDAARAEVERLRFALAWVADDRTTVCEKEDIARAAIDPQPASGGAE